MSYPLAQICELSGIGDGARSFELIGELGRPFLASSFVRVPEAWQYITLASMHGVWGGGALLS